MKLARRKFLHLKSCSPDTCNSTIDRVAASGQLPPPNHVSDGGSFRRKRPWYPHRHEHATIPSWAAHDPRQHARQRRAVARRVLLAVPIGGFDPVADIAEPWH